MKEFAIGFGILFWVVVGLYFVIDIGVPAHVTCRDRNGNITFDEDLQDMHITSGGAFTGYRSDGSQVGLIGDCIAEEL